MAEATVKPWGETTIVGKPIPRIDGYERVSGKAVFPADVILPNLQLATSNSQDQRMGVWFILIGSWKSRMDIPALGRSNFECL